MLKITRDKPTIKYVIWNGMELYCQMFREGWYIDICLINNDQQYIRFHVKEFNLNAVQIELDTFFKNKLNCKRFLTAIFHGKIQDGILYPEYIYNDI